MRWCVKFSAWVVFVAFAACESSSRQESSPVVRGRDDRVSEQPARDESEAARLAVAEGDDLRSSSRWSDAIAAYDRALALDPRNAAARDGRAIAAARLDQGSSLDAVANEVTMMRQATLREFDASCAQAREALEQARFVEARGIVLHAKGTLDRRETFLRTTEFEDRSRRAADLLAEIDRAEELHGRL